MSELQLDPLFRTRRFCFYLSETAPDPSLKEGEEPRYRVSLVFEGEPGHFPTGAGDMKKLRQPWYWTRETCDAMNANFDLTPKEAFAIVASSMGAGPRHRTPRSES